MTITTNTLRPGLLVSLKTSCRGNVRYDKIDLDERIDADAEITKWETTRTIADRAEQEAAVKARTKAVGYIRRVCTASAFGYLCPESNADILELAMVEARRVVDEFNATAQLTRLHVYCIVGRIAQDDAEAIRAINSEVRELIDTMAEGIVKLDVKAVRDAAIKAKSLGSMLSPDAQARVSFAIDAARAAAKQIVAAGEAAEIEIDQYTIRQITNCRTAFLDMREEVEVARPAAVSRSIDLAPEPEVTDEMLAAFSGPLPAKRG